ncbi:MAG: Ribosomal RNA small subunit methyltransferase B [Candidatus Uhrbacteria bacterium GW2011_GWF2_44_350]|uniref:Ribosomal RNA small subunit methyltransferase B n=2 Tax=Candidatus Uhriibacteriota TaxID=1752732 RepID=A0A0G1JE09_9BACT|nr:MAG: Ribosomal RNA small subunit methyltransferase B [Candidatus Uhrbacteria bacterium GW2011_GWF2_44_350]
MKNVYSKRQNMPKKTQIPFQLTTRLEQQFGHGALQSIISAFNEKRLPTFRVNILKSNDEEVMRVLRSENIAFERIKDLPHAFKIRNRSDKDLLEHPLCKNGKIYLQGVASMLPVLALDPQPGERVLDLCAAPGSKTSQIAAAMKNGQLLACDDNEVRFQKLENTLQMQGVNFVETRLQDAALLYKEFPESFDKILADVPCSAEGRIDLNDPRSYRFWSEKNITAHAKLQRRLLRSAVACLKPGGTLVYSTCTLAPEEDGEMIEWLLATFPELKTEAFRLPFVSTHPGPANSLYVLPSRESEGFFVAKIRKGANC